MSIVKVFVGLDYHDCFVQVCVLDSTGEVLMNRRVSNAWKAVAEAVTIHGTVVEAAIESCCGAANLAEELMQNAGWSVHLAHPGYVARMKQSPDKTDFGDARLLADLVRVGYLPKVWLAPEAIRELRRLVRYRQQLVDQRRNLKLRIGAMLREQRVGSAPANPWTRRWWYWLTTEAALSEEGRWIVQRYVAQMKLLSSNSAEVESRLTQRTAADPVVRKLRSFRGIGLVTAAMLRAEIGDFRRFRSGKQLSRFCGLTPRNASSGQRVADAGLIKAGNPQLRSALVQAAHSLRLHDQRWGALSYRMARKGKHGSLIVAAIANRFVRWLYHQMQSPELAI
jgi:transposase